MVLGMILLIFAFIGDYYIHHSILCKYNITKETAMLLPMLYMLDRVNGKVIKYINRIIDKRQKYILFFIACQIIFIPLQ